MTRWQLRHFPLRPHQKESRAAQAGVGSSGLMCPWPSIDKRGKHALISPLEPLQSGKKALTTLETPSGPHWQRDMPLLHRARMA